MRTCLNISAYDTSIEEIIQAYPVRKSRNVVIAPPSECWTRIYDSELDGASSSFQEMVYLAEQLASATRKPILALPALASVFEIWYTGEDGKIAILPVDFESPGSDFKSLLSAMRPLLSRFPRLPWSSLFGQTLKKWKPQNMANPFIPPTLISDFSSFAKIDSFYFSYQAIERNCSELPADLQQWHDHIHLAVKIGPCFPSSLSTLLREWRIEQSDNGDILTHNPNDFG